MTKITGSITGPVAVRTHTDAADSTITEPQVSGFDGSFGTLPYTNSGNVAQLFKVVDVTNLVNCTYEDVAIVKAGVPSGHSTVLEPHETATVNVFVKLAEDTTPGKDIPFSFVINTEWDVAP